MKSPEEFLTVSELNNFIRDVLNSGFPQALWVCGEIQELRDKKHLYFTLSEKDPDSNAVIAKMGVTLWANNRPRIEAVLQKAENAFVLKDDIQVKLLCKIDFYPPFGQIRLIVEAIDPTYTLGKIAQDRQRIINLLKEKGVLDKNKRLELPRVPQHIGLITSQGSAAYHDFMDELKKSGFAFRVVLADCLMQGKAAEKSVVAALKVLNQQDDLDAIVITRGGGSVTELSCFDSQIIAEAIAASQIPVLSGIGHEINTTITDLASYGFAKTPTAVARLLIGRIQEFNEHLKDRHQAIIELAKESLQSKRQAVRNQAVTLQQSVSGLIKAQQSMVFRTMEAFKRLPISLCKQSRAHVLSRNDVLKKTIQLRLQESKVKIQTYQKFVDVADPKNVLKKGFSITRNAQGKTIRSLSDTAKGQIISTQVVDGLIISETKETKR